MVMSLTIGQPFLLIVASSKKWPLTFGTDEMLEFKEISCEKQKFSIPFPNPIIHVFSKSLYQMNTVTVPYIR